MADQNLKIQLSAIDKTQRAFAAVRGGLKRVSGSILNVRTALVGLAGAAGLQIFAKQIDDLAKASSRLGLTVNELQSLQFAASQTGASAEELEKGLTRFSRSISEASSGIGTGLRSFEALGITVTNAQGDLRPTSELLNEVSDRLTQIQDPADRVRIAFDLFGRSGVNLVNTLQQGSGSVKELQDQFNAVTLELTGENAKAVEDANDRFDKLRIVLGSVGQRITSVVLPVLADVATFLVSTLLSAISASITGIRNLLNTIVDLGNELGIFEEKIEAFTFGADVTEDLDRIVSNLNSSLEKNQKQIEKTQTPYVSLNDSVDNLAKGFDRVNTSTQSIFERFPDYASNYKELNVSVNAVKDGLDTTSEAAKTLGEKFADAKANGVDQLEDGLMRLANGTGSVKDAFRSMANSILSDLTRMAIQQNITNPLRSFLGLTPKAIGGSVQAGQPYMVGERGKELFVPSQSGSIIPNDKLGGGGAVTVNQTVNLTTGVAQTVRTEVMNMLPQIQQAAVSAVLDARRRGGAFGSAFGG
jgi:uncharacterized phage infection (PIP) family protein YhgE